MFRIRTIALATCLFIPALLATPPLAAQDDPEKGETRSETTLNLLSQCSKIGTDTERLACFDREVAALIGAADKGEVRLVDTQEVKETRRRLFGFSLPKIGLFSGDDGEDMDLLESTITSVRQVAQDEWHFRIEEGDALWRIRNPSFRMRAPKEGDTVVFKKATMGTYFIRINGRKGVRGNRIG